MLASSSCIYWWLGLSCFQILQPVILNNADPIYRLELFDHFCLEYLAGWCETHKHCFFYLQTVYGGFQAYPELSAVFSFDYIAVEPWARSFQFLNYIVPL